MDVDTVANSQTCECEAKVLSQEYNDYEALVCADCRTPVVVLWGDESRLQPKPPVINTQSSR